MLSGVPSHLQLSTTSVYEKNDLMIEVYFESLDSLK